MEPLKGPNLLQGCGGIVYHIGDGNMGLIIGRQGRQQLPAGQRAIDQHGATGARLIPTLFTTNHSLCAPAQGIGNKKMAVGVTTGKGNKEIT